VHGLVGDWPGEPYLPSENAQIGLGARHVVRGIPLATAILPIWDLGIEGPAKSASIRNGNRPETSLLQTKPMFLH
jgi:hypothetical protein